MEFRLDEGQQELRDTVRRFCAARFPLERIGQQEGPRLDRGAWRELAELGVFGLLAPQAQGGLGLGMLDAALVFEQLGEHGVRGPALWTALAAPHVAGAASGACVVGGVDAAEAGGAALLVEHAGDLDALLILQSDGVWLCNGAALPRFDALAPFDPLTPVARCAPPQGVRVGDADAAALLRVRGTALAAALLLGVSSAALESARRYALEREQFGTPIGSFQAVAHLLADMYVRCVLARSAVYAAAALLDDPASGDSRRAAAAAKLLAGEAALENARASIQIHGGVGFTWEMPPHYLLKRAWVLEHAFGTGEAHAVSLGSSLEDALA